MANTPQGATAPDCADSARIDEAAHLEFQAVLTPDQVQDYEATQHETWGPRRRMTLISLTRSKAELLAGFAQGENGADVLMDMIDEVHTWRDHLIATADLAETASARLIITCSALLQTNASTTPTMQGA